MHFTRVGGKPTSAFVPRLLFERVSTIGGKNLATVSLVLKAACVYMLWKCFLLLPNLVGFCVGTGPAPGLQEDSTMGLCFCISLWVPGNVVNASVLGSSQKLTCQLRGKMRVVRLYVSPLCIFYKNALKKSRWKVTSEMRATKEEKCLACHVAWVHSYEYSACLWDKGLFMQFSFTAKVLCFCKQQ